MKNLFVIFIFFAFVAEDVMSMDTIANLLSEREAYIHQFRVTGKQDLPRVEKIEQGIRKFIASSDGERVVRALFELATMQRFTGRFDEAIETYKQMASLAQSHRLTELQFDAWFGVARSHIYGTKDHGAAAEAFESAVKSAGAKPSPKQRYEIADYASQLLAARGELDAALKNGIEAIRFAQNDADLFYAHLDTGDVLQKYAESCDYRKLIDAKTIDDGEDTWAACRRAVEGAEKHYKQARETARRLGWTFLENEAKGFISRLTARLFIIQQKAQFERLGSAGVFSAQDLNSVVVNEEFTAGASEISEYPLAAIIDYVAPESQASDPRTIYLRGLKMDLDGRSDKALDYFIRAVTLLLNERSSLVDLRGRGTMIENRPELVRDLALRLLAYGRVDEAFATFESIKSHGLGKLLSVYSDNRFTERERRWLAQLIDLESQESSKLAKFVELTISGIEQNRSIELLEEVDRIEQQQRQLREQRAHQEAIDRLKFTADPTPSLSEFRKLVDKAGIPVMLYWVTHTNVVVWVVSPGEMEIKTVFLPEVAVIDKVNRVLLSASTPTQPFDDKAARELYTYLIKPFSNHLSAKQVLIIPQGPLVKLPFEALVDPESEQYLIEQFAVSYAPNATIASNVLKARIPDISRVTALFDREIEDSTKEISRIETIKGLKVSKWQSNKLTGREAIIKMGGQGIGHVLLHGIHVSEAPLQSEVLLKNLGQYPDDKGKITAAELLAVDWKSTGLAVFSSCEGADVKTRISNEQYGISWSLLAGGVDHVVLSRWRVKMHTNAKWMETFYQALINERITPANAAAKAMRVMIKSDKGDPYYWAAPQVFGR